MSTLKIINNTPSTIQFKYTLEPQLYSYIPVPATEIWSRHSDRYIETIDMILKDHDVMIPPNTIIETEATTDEVKVITINTDIDRNYKIVIDRINYTGRRIYKYLGLSDYLPNIIRNEPKSIRATNIYGFNDAYEGLVDSAPVISTPECYYTDTLSCNKCALYKNGKCKRNTVCDLCKYNYTCGKDKSKCKIPNITQPLDRGNIRDCAQLMYQTELYNKYIVCFSKKPDSSGLLEKFCGRYGFILEYDTYPTTKLIDIEYKDRPTVNNADVADIAYSIYQNGYNVPESDKGISFKNSEFSYEDEVRIFLYKQNVGTTYIQTDEAELGIKLTKVRLMYDSMCQGIDESSIDKLNKTGLAILNRGIPFEVQGTIDYINGNDIGLKASAHAYYDDAVAREKFLSNLGSRFNN